jgi:predicted XRE-type DNA-binding protein
MAGLVPAIHALLRVLARKKTWMPATSAGMTTKRPRLMAKAKKQNVFADLGLPNSEQELLKAQLTLQIYRIVKARKLTQAQAGVVLGIKQPHVSALMRNRAGNVEVGRLMEFLTVLGQDVRITVKPTRKAQGEMEVVVG